MVTAKVVPRGHDPCMNSVDGWTSPIETREGVWSARAMIVEIIRYRVPEERAEALVAAYRLAQSALVASPHCLAFELTRCIEERERFILRIEWDSLDGHLQGFRKSDVFREFLGHVRPFIEAIEEMQHYELTDVVGRK